MFAVIPHAQHVTLMIVTARAVVIVQFSNDPVRYYAGRPVVNKRVLVVPL